MVTPAQARALVALVERQWLPNEHYNELVAALAVLRLIAAQETA